MKQPSESRREQMPEPHNWTMMDGLVMQVRKLWDRGDILSALVSSDSLFPRRLTLKCPTAIDLRDRFDEVRQWVSEIRNMPCCRVVVRDHRHRVMGTNPLPEEIWIDSTEDALKLIGKQKDASRFLSVLDATRRAQPALLDWLAKYPHRAMAHCEEWKRFLDVVGWLRNNPRPALYLRQVDIPGVHSKFFETYRGILSELFDTALAPDTIGIRTSGANLFERRYGFLCRPERIRFRSLDPLVSIVPGAPRADITLDSQSFAELSPAISRVFITENEVNYLAFPDVEASLVLFGAGYGFEMLRNVGWLSQSLVYYWGDIDTHGFAILDQLRSSLANTQSFLMDRDTLFAFQSQWGREDKQAICELTRLTSEEKAFYEEIRDNQIRTNLRLEQERIGFRWVSDAVQALLQNSSSCDDDD